MKSFINVGTIGALGRENDPVITPLSPRNHPLITPFVLGNASIKSLCGMWKYVASLLIVLFVGVGDAWGESQHHYVAVAADNPNNYTVKLNVKRVRTDDGCKSWAEWEQETMSKAGVTFEGKKLYCHDYYTCNGLYELKFQYYDSEWVEEHGYGGGAVYDYYNNYVYNYDNSSWYGQKTMSNGAKVYFDASNWSQTAIKLVTAHANCEKYYTLTNITGTKLYYGTNTDSWSDAMGWGVVGGTDRSGNNNEWITDISSHAKEYTGLKNWSLDGTGDANAYLCVNNGNKGQQPNMYYFEDYTGQDNTSTLQFNNTQTLNTVLKMAGAGTYSTANSKAAITMTSYELVAQGSTDDNEEELSTTENTQGIIACRTATTVYTVGELATGYQFDGFYDAANGGNRLDTDVAGTYTFYPTSATTVYARFSEKTWSVSFTNDGHGTVTSPAASPQTVGELTGISINASNSTGYHFSRWTIVSGSGSFTSAATTASNTFKPTSASTVRADFAGNNWTITLTNHGATTAGTTSIAVTYDSNSNLSGTPAITKPAKNGYNFGGYWTGENGTGTQIIDANGNVIASAGGGSTYTDASKNWKYNNNLELHANWTFKTLYFTSTSGNNWSTTANWTDGFLPTIDHDVVITEPVTVDVKTAKAKSVVLDQQTGNIGKLIINAGQELVIAGTLRKKTDVLEDGPTEAEDVVINSDASNGLGALVMGSHDGTNQATVNFYTLSHGTSGSSASVAQYVGVPFTDATVLSAFYNSWVYRINHEALNIFWERMSGSESLRAFKGYSVFSADGAGHTYEMQGTLAPSENQNLNLYYNGGIGIENPNDETLLANSWMAPIKIAAFTEEDFTSAHAVATIYIFNAGSLDNYKAAGGDPADNTFVKGDGPGQYSTYPILEEKAKAVSAVIPAMQSFSVFTNKDKGATTGDDNLLILDYNRLVYEPAIANPTTPAPNRSPKRAKAETSEREEMLLCVRGANGPADRVRILAHEDFDEGFENGWDGHKIFGESFTPQLYAMTTDGNMAVNCIPEYEGTVLGFKPSDVDNSYTFYFRYDGDETLYLNDLKTEQSTLIQDENTYPFTSSVEDAEARFVISAMPIPHTPTGIQSVQSDGEQGAKVRKLFINGAIYIIRSGRMYDVLGKTMRNEK